MYIIMVLSMRNRQKKMDYNTENNVMSSLGFIHCHSTKAKLNNVYKVNHKQCG